MPAHNNVTMHCGNEKDKYDNYVSHLLVSANIIDLSDDIIDEIDSMFIQKFNGTSRLCLAPELLQEPFRSNMTVKYIYTSSSITTTALNPDNTSTNHKADDLQKMLNLEFNFQSLLKDLHLTDPADRYAITINKDNARNVIRFLDTCSIEIDLAVTLENKISGENLGLAKLRISVDNIPKQNDKCLQLLQVYSTTNAILTIAMKTENIVFVLANDSALLRRNQSLVDFNTSQFNEIGDKTMQFEKTLNMLNNALDATKNSSATYSHVVESPINEGEQSFTIEDFLLTNLGTLNIKLTELPAPITSSSEHDGIKTALLEEPSTEVLSAETGGSGVLQSSPSCSSINTRPTIDPLTLNLSPVAERDYHDLSNNGQKSGHIMTDRDPEVEDILSNSRFMDRSDSENKDRVPNDQPRPPPNQMNLYSTIEEALQAHPFKLISRTGLPLCGMVTIPTSSETILNKIFLTLRSIWGLNKESISINEYQMTVYVPSSQWDTISVNLRELFFDSDGPNNVQQAYTMPDHVYYPVMTMMRSRPDPVNFLITAEYMLDVVSQLRRQIRSRFRESQATGINFQFRDTYYNQNLVTSCTKTMEDRSKKYAAFETEEQKIAAEVIHDSSVVESLEKTAKFLSILQGTYLFQGRATNYVDYVRRCLDLPGSIGPEARHVIMIYNGFVANNPRSVGDAYSCMAMASDPAYTIDILREEAQYRIKDIAVRQDQTSILEAVVKQALDANPNAAVEHLSGRVDKHSSMLASMVAKEYGVIVKQSSGKSEPEIGANKLLKPTDKSSEHGLLSNEKGSTVPNSASIIKPIKLSVSGFVGETYIDIIRSWYSSDDETAHLIESSELMKTVKSGVVSQGMLRYKDLIMGLVSKKVSASSLYNTIIDL